MRSNDWVLMGVGLTFGIAIGAITSSATANLFSDAGARATIYMGIAGIAGVVATILANGYLSRMEMSAADKDRQDADNDKKRALAHAVIFKMMDIHTNFHHLNEHLKDCSARREGDAEPWAYVQPLANFPAAEKFSIDEMAMVMSLGDYDLFNKMINIGRVYFSVADVFNVYCR